MKPARAYRARAALVRRPHFQPDRANPPVLAIVARAASSRRRPSPRRRCPGCTARVKISASSSTTPPRRYPISLSSAILGYRTDRRRVRQGAGQLSRGPGIAERGSLQRTRPSRSAEDAGRSRKLSAMRPFPDRLRFGRSAVFGFPSGGVHHRVVPPRRAARRSSWRASGSACGPPMTGPPCDPRDFSGDGGRDRAHHPSTVPNAARAAGDIARGGPPTASTPPASNRQHPAKTSPRNASLRASTTPPSPAWAAARTSSEGACAIRVGDPRRSPSPRMWPLAAR